MGSTALMSNAHARFPRGVRSGGGGTAQLWQQVKLGAGGYITGIDIANDGTRVIRADVYGAYVKSIGDTQWRQMQTGTAFGANAGYITGPYEVAIAKTDSNRIYMMNSDGYFYKSTDKGVSFTKMSAFNGGVQIAPVGLDGNRSAASSACFAARNNGRFMAVDPYDKNVVYVTTPFSGVFLTLDGGTTWQTVSGIPTPTLDSDTRYSYGVCVAIDPSAAAVNGRSPIIYIHAYGSRVYKSTNGGSATPTFATTTTGPTTTAHMVCDFVTGRLYVADNATNGSGTGGTVWTYNGTTWTDLGTSNIHAIAPDPTTAGRVVFMDADGNTSVSTTYGTSPSTLTPVTKVVPNITWIGLTPNTFYNGDIAFNPLNGKLTVTMGLGVWSCTPASSGAVTWTDESEGIEELVTTFISASPAQTYPLVGAWDRPLFKVIDPNAYPATQRPPISNQETIQIGWAGDYAKSVPNTHVAIVNLVFGYGDLSGISTDGGLTWTQFATKPNRVLLTTNASTAIGNGVLHFASVPSIIAPSSIGGRREVTYYGYMATTTAPTAAGSNVLHFGGGLPAGVAVGQAPRTWDDSPNATFVLSVLAVNYLGVTGDVQLDGGARYDIPTGTRIGFRNQAISINSNLSVSATTSTTVTMTGQPTGAVLQSGETLSFDSGKAGCIAASTPLNIIWMGSNDEPYPWYTKDGGATWNNVIIGTSITGFGSAGEALAGADGPGWGHSYTINCICFAADSVTANRFVGFNARTSAEGGGIYTSDDSGDTWTKRGSNANIGNNQNGYQSKIEAVPGNAHHFFMSGCNHQFQNCDLRYSTDTNNATWTAIALVSEVEVFTCTGAAAPGKNYPTVYFIGKYNGVVGIWRGTGNAADWAAGSGTGTGVTWTNVGSYGKYAFDWMNIPSAMAGDPSVYGRVYVGRGQSGVAMGYLG